MRGIKEQIIKTLEEHEPSRDDDNKLYSMILFNRVDNHHKHDFSEDQRKGAVKLLAMMYEGKLPNFETIGRFRRKLQQENEQLRGKKYEARHQHAQKYTETNMEGSWKI
tara:strand:+ start:1187 stop:1513 length:327 start_codon:yes stop_codon:yes gene_type:complete